MNENEILLYHVIDTCEEKEYNQQIVENNSAFLLRQLSHIRGNVLECIDWEDVDTALEIQGAYGALTGMISQKVNSLVCMVEEETQKGINHKRHSKKENITYKVGNIKKGLQDMTGSFDVIVAVEDTGIPVDILLACCKGLLSEKGKLIFACNNPLGLRYLNGNRDRDEDGCFEVLVQGRQKGGYRKSQLCKALEEQGCKYQMFYPYPNQYFPMSLYTDDFLPQKGELNDNNHIRDFVNFSLFHEGMVFDKLIEEHIFAEFSNAFLVVANWSKE